MKEHRESRGYSQKRLANEAGISISQVAFIETGERNLTRDKAAKIADVLELTAKERAELLATTSEDQRPRTVKERLAMLEDAVAEIASVVRRLEGGRPKR